jgi:hypothetical protein
MALLRPGRAQDSPPYFRRVLYTYTRRGQVIAANWPRKRPSRPSLYAKSIRDQMARVVAFMRNVSSTELAPTKDAIDAWNRTHRGYQGTAAIRLEDHEFLRLTGRLYTIEMPDGTRYYPATAWLDVQFVLDWTGLQQGTLLMRTQAGWRDAPIDQRTRAFVSDLG